LAVEKKKQNNRYHKILKIDGRHPFQDKVPLSYVSYKVRKRPNGRILYFNFTLAKEMGLIPHDHPHTYNQDLIDTLLDTFSIQIINEYDIINRTPIAKDTIKPHSYMATRYLQLQHPNKRGLTSGDGRSIWNGYVEHKGNIWDISSCGTGATCLSPATAINNKFFKTGDPEISYGCGYSEIREGLSDAIFSEIMHRNGLETERSLAIIEYPKGISINVRAAKNLLRPSHFFTHLKQGHYERLKALTDFYIERENANKNWNKKTYDYFLQRVCDDFAKTVAKFEVEYIFCWMDWDGDNILMNGGIIDYGSIRQFGLYHHDYRFDDVERWSTTIKEQKQKVKYIIQNFCQMVDFLKKKVKSPLQSFANDPTLERFEKTFKSEKTRLMADKIGFAPDTVAMVSTKFETELKSFLIDFHYFEEITSKKGPERVSDGVITNAVFCMRDLLRELPAYHCKSANPMSAQDLLNIMKSEYATKKDLELTPKQLERLLRMQDNYLNLIQKAAAQLRLDSKELLDIVQKRSAHINRAARVTGDSICHVSEEIARKKSRYQSEDVLKLIEDFIEKQVLVPENQRKNLRIRPKTKKLLFHMLRVVDENRSGI
jgi:uncharacterized protein YdiU (UPF0061 family)